MQKRRNKKGPSKQKRSPIWLAMPDEEFARLVAASRNIGDVLNAFGFENIGRNHYTAKDRIAALGLSTAHFNPMNRDFGFKRSLEQLLVADGPPSDRKNVKRRVLAEGLLIERCAECDLPPLWLEKRLVLILDHINGDRRDHRLMNLRLLCPNCNSQTATFCGRNKPADDAP